MKAMRQLSKRFALLITLPFFTTALVYAQTANRTKDTLIIDSENYLELRGKVFESHCELKDAEKTALDSAQIEVHNKAGRICLQGLTDDKGRLAFRLPLNSVFTISVSKKGYVKKTIRIDTYVPPKFLKAYVYTFNVDIFEKIEGLNTKVLDQPISQVHFLVNIKQFDYDKVYTSKVNGDLQKMYREYYALKRAEEKEKKGETTPTTTVSDSSATKKLENKSTKRTHPPKH
jgi:hypothetical protein